MEFDKSMEFDINKVFTAVNADEVKIGSIGLFADNLADLKKVVVHAKKNINYDFLKLNSIHDNCYSYRFFNGKDYYNLFYLVEEPKEVKEEYRPYNSIEEFIRDYCNNKIGINVPCLFRPTIWIKSYSGIEKFITEYATADNTVRLGGHEGFWYELKDLFEQYTYLDGSRCGIKEL